ncbi:MAG: peptide synthetase, partial [Proteobacteria bacterium]|nr:peptide synthetase [Pseudomonadota bacterium]
VETGDRVFIGNSAIVSAGAKIDSDSLIGVYSKLPPDLQVKSGETWFGSPAMKLPNRQRVEVSAQATYMPPVSMRVGRALFETFHTALPTALFITLGYITADIIEAPLTEGRLLTAFGIFLAAGVVIAMLLVVVAAAFKWLMMGVYRPIMRPMWSWWAMRTEAVAVLYGGLVGKTSLEFLRGTPFLPWLLRLWGTKIGKGVMMDWTDITEFDCVKIGDYAVINSHSAPQTHLYEDRVMKVGRIEIGKGVTVGTGVYILYDTKIGDYAQLLPLTLVMKGENIPASTVWQGAPAVPVVAKH